MSSPQISLASCFAHPPDAGKVIAFPQVGGLHHRYERLAA